MSDLQQALQDLTDALSGVPERLSALAQAAHAAEHASQALALWLRETDADAEARIAALAEHLAAIGDASSAEHAQYVAVIEGIQPYIEAEAFATGGAAFMGNSLGLLAHLELEELKLMPVQLRSLAEETAAALDELASHLPDLERSLHDETERAATRARTAQAELEAASEQLADATRLLAATAEEQASAAEQATDELAQGLRQLQADLTARFESLAASLSHRGEELEQSLRHAHEATAAELHAQLGGLESALSTLGADVGRQGEEVSRAATTLDSRLADLAGLVDPLRNGIESAREAAREAGLPV